MKIQGTVEIYEIIDPRDGSVRYIGKSVDSRKRFQQHMREMRRNTPLYVWIEKMRNMGLAPTMRVAQTCAESDWMDCEKQAIASARAKGYRLLNVAEGGDQPYCSPKVRSENARKMNARLKEDPVAAFIKHAKRTAARMMKDDALTESHRETMRQCAAKRPDLFGAWASV